ncbi:hypothetical protein M0Q97_06700 [Candidatus Dojkabacteria bacterium]|jgi:hypothetical protein|nr:hypothetical protein [Candidatus Dojkabacteria bacterium]
MNKEISFFDLDNSLWYIKADIWIIDKNKPNEPILKISPIEFILIKSGIYAKDDILVEYNNESYYISQDMMERIMRKKKIRLRDLGISYAEYFDEDILNKKDVQYLLNNIKHLIGKNSEIGILTARSDRKKHASLLNKLRKKLEEFGLEIDKIYFVSESIRVIGYFDKILYDKNKILLEHLIGLTIEDNHFIPIKKDAYTKINFYDDIKSNFMNINKMQDYFDFLIRNSDDDCVEYIKNRLENNTLIICNNLVTNNEVNPFETNIIKLNNPIKYPIKVSDNKLTVKFENFQINY